MPGPVDVLRPQARLLQIRAACKEAGRRNGPVRSQMASFESIKAKRSLPSSYGDCGHAPHAVSLQFK